MVTLAPRISRRLIEAVVRLDDRTQPIAETCRRVGAEADRLGLTRPSYQRIRVLVHESRRIRRRPSVADIVMNTPWHLRTSEDIINLLSAMGARPIGR